MSDLLIKDMEMPKNCFDCMFHWHGDGTTYCLAQSKMHDLHHIKWQCKGYEEQMKYREPTCPLVPVPPHGRLIDAGSWTFPTPHRNPSNDYMRGWNACMKSVLQQPTVIPAEEGET